VTSTIFDANGNSLPGEVKRIDPATGTTIATIPIGAGAFDIDVSPGVVWVANYDSGSVIRIDPATNQIVTTLPVPYASGVTVGLGAVWVVGGDGKVTRIDPTTNQIVTTIPTQTTGGFVATGNGAVWVTHPGDRDLSDGSLSRIDPGTNQVVANTPLGSFPQEIVVSGTDIWVGMYGEPTVVRVSATTNAVLNRVAVSSKVYTIAVGSGVVWAVHNLPVPAGGTQAPAGVVSRISATAPIAAVMPSPNPAVAPTPTPPASSSPLAGGTLFVSTYFIVSIPAGWSLVYSSDPNTLSFRGPGSQELAIGSATCGCTLEEVTAQYIAYLKGKMGADPEQTEAATMGGVPGRILTYHVLSNGITLHALVGLSVKNGRAYQIVFLNTAGTESADRALFLAMLASFSFLSAAG
jgi:hypothetical protein